MDLTRIVLVVIAAVAAALEILAVVGGRLGWEWIRLISPVMRNDGRIWLIWPWLWGVLPGHWWYPIAARDGAWIFLLVLTVALLALDLYLGKSAPAWLPIASFVVGAASGAAFWAMGYRS